MLGDASDHQEERRKKGGVAFRTPTRGRGCEMEEKRRRGCAIRPTLPRATAAVSIERRPDDTSDAEGGTEYGMANAERLRDTTTPMPGARPPPATMLGEKPHNLTHSLGDLPFCFANHHSFSAHFVLDTVVQMR
jgi:hypothetical protein